MSRAIVSEPDRGEHIEHQNNRVYTLSQRVTNMIGHIGDELNPLTQGYKVHIGGEIPSHTGIQI